MFAIQHHIVLYLFRPALLRLMSRRFAGSTGEALETLRKKAQQAQHVNGYLQLHVSENILAISVT
jgi:hypothetical protein